MIPKPTARRIAAMLQGCRTVGGTEIGRVTVYQLLKAGLSKMVHIQQSPPMLPQYNTAWDMVVRFQTIRGSYLCR